MGAVEARAHVADLLIEVRQSVFEDAKAGKPRARMTLAHELGHVYLNHVGPPQHRTATQTGAPAFIKPANSTEHQAKVFAAALLMPKALAQQYSSADEIASKTGVSFEAAEIRFREVHVRGRAKATPPDIVRQIEKLRQHTKTPERLGKAKSTLDDSQTAKLAWLTAPVAPNHDPQEYRIIDSRWIIRWSRYGLMKPGGWRVHDGKIVAWDDEVSR
jgi:Zn-dependent peptidase ImmA (M78 family)